MPQKIGNPLRILNVRLSPGTFLMSRALTTSGSRAIQVRPSLIFILRGAVITGMKDSLLKSKISQSSLGTVMILLLISATGSDACHSS
jgi:hypothetical protein